MPGKAKNLPATFAAVNLFADALMTTKTSTQLARTAKKNTKNG